MIPPPEPSAEAMAAARALQEDPGRTIEEHAAMIDGVFAPRLKALQTAVANAIEMLGYWRDRADEMAKQRDEARAAPAAPSDDARRLLEECQSVLRNMKTLLCEKYHFEAAAELVELEKRVGAHLNQHAT